ncbi:MAG: hypothetical protein ACYTAS_10775 [Planctomycetota bacterium]|jgi:hypothetical protein
MRTVTISDELFDALKGFVVDPFDDTPDIVVGRLIEIVNKAKNRWSPLDSCEASDKPQAPTKHRAPQLDELPQATAEEEVVLL